MFGLDSVGVMFAGAAFGACLLAWLLVSSHKWHGHFSSDSHFGIQKFHTEPTSRVGGVAVFSGVLVAFVLSPPAVQTLLGPLLLASLPAFLFGLAEDLSKQVGVLPRLLATMSSGLLGWYLTGYAISDVNVPGFDQLLGFTLVSVLFTALAVGGVANAINIIDGLNGIAVGTIIIIACSFALLANVLGDDSLAQTSFIIAAAVFGFGLFNWPFGKLFLGDGGAYFLGFGVAWLGVMLMARHPEVSAWAPLLVCAYPVLEVGFSVQRRRKRGQHLGHPDRLHLHSLVNRRFVRKLLPHASNMTRNSVAGAFMWAPSLVLGWMAVYNYTDSPTLIACLLVFALTYSVAYARLTQFRWCMTPATMSKKLAVQING